MKYYAGMAKTMSEQKAEYNPGVQVTELHVELRQIKSKTDGSYDLVLNVGEYNLAEVKQLMDKIGDLFGVAFVHIREGGDSA